LPVRQAQGLEPVERPALWHTARASSLPTVNRSVRLGLSTHSDRPNPAEPEPSTPPGKSNLETRNPKQLMKSKQPKKKTGLLSVQIFPHSNFKLVSDFELRISDF
jgi:hypothetical protein